jgi:hypothetical protein
VAGHHYRPEPLKCSLFNSSYFIKPCVFFWLANSTIKIAFLVTSPTSIICPIWLKMFNVIPKIQSESKAPVIAKGTVSKIMKGQQSFRTEQQEQDKLI